MKVLVATDCYVFNMGGVTASVLALCTGLRRCGHEVKVLTLSNKHHSFRNGNDYYIQSFPAFYYPGMRISFARQDPLLQELKDWHPDIIHVQTEGSVYRFSLDIMRHCQIPLVMTCHTDYAYFVFGRFCTCLPVRAVMRTLGRWIYRPAARVIAPSGKAAQFPVLQPIHNCVTVIPNGMETEKYQARFSNEERRAFRNSLGFDVSARVLVTVTRLSAEKNLQELISYFPELIKENQNVKLLIVGDGPYRGRLERLTKKRKLQESILFTGRIPAEEVWRYFSAGDVFVSASRFEVHSMSYLEALANGLPLLCRSDDALEGVLEHGKNGFVYHSQEEFTTFALRLLCNDVLRSSMALCSAQKADDFSCDAFAAAVLRVYEDAIRGNADAYR